jgi:hypothetical protein
MTIFNILRPFRIFYGNLVYVACTQLVFIPFWCVWTKKNLATMAGIDEVIFKTGCFGQVQGVQNGRIFVILGLLTLGNF